MKVFRKMMLIALLFVGGFSTVIPNANAQIDLVVGAVTKILNIGVNAGKTAAMIKTVESILSKTGKMEEKLGGLKDISGQMSKSLSDLWKATDKFYKDLKKVSQGVESYKEMLRLVDDTRSVYGYCGSAMTLSARSSYLTLSEHEYILTRSVEIQEYVQQRIQKLFNLVTSGNVSMNDYERMQMLRQISDEQAMAVREARMLVARVKGFELSHQRRAKDEAFRDSFLNMKL